MQMEFGTEKSNVLIVNCEFKPWGDIICYIGLLSHHVGLYSGQCAGIFLFSYLLKLEVDEVKSQVIPIYRKIYVHWL